MSLSKLFEQPSTSRHPDRQTDGIFFGLSCLLRHKNHEHFLKGENFFFSHAIIILSLFTYSVCDEKVKKLVTVFATDRARVGRGDMDT